MDSDREAKRPKIAQQPPHSPMTPQDVSYVTSTPCVYAYPDSFLLPIPWRPAHLVTRSSKIVPSQEISPKRWQLSELLLPNIDLELDDVSVAEELCDCIKEKDDARHMYGSNPRRRAFPTAKTKSGRAPNYSRMLKPKYSQLKVLTECPDKFSDIAIELDTTEEEYFGYIQVKPSNED